MHFTEMPADQPAGTPSVPTIREIFDWYRESEVRENLSQVGQKERELQRGRFCAFQDSEPLPYGERPYTSFRPFHLMRFIKSLEDARSAWTKRRIAASVHAAMNAAVRLGYISRNPFWGLRLPMGKNGRDWTDEEYWAILRCSAPWFRRFVIFIRHTGSRPGEARILQWSHVNLPGKLIVLKEHKTAVVTGETRKIRLNSVAVNLLAWLQRHRTNGTFVFANKHRRPWTIGSLTKHLRAVRRRAGLAAEVKLHGGRHTFITRGLMNGVDLATMATLAGHRTVATTQRYTHLATKSAYLEEAVEKATGGRASALKEKPRKRNSAVGNARKTPLGNRRGLVPEKEERCGEWLRAHLKVGPQRVGSTRSEAESAGFSARTLYRCVERLAIQQFRGADGKKWWRSPARKEGAA